jgi:membrane-associated protease RseP (regulator of RpoE activity)
VLNFLLSFLQKIVIKLTYRLKIRKGNDIMKPLFTFCLVAFLPVMAFAQATPPALDAPAKPQPFEPIVAAAHSGLGRIGVRLAFDKTGVPTIVGMTRGSPAVDFGLRVGDVIIKVDKNYTNSLSEDEVRLALHGDPGTGVELTIQRDGGPKFVVRAVERRVLFDDMEELAEPPMSEVARP